MGVGGVLSTEGLHARGAGCGLPQPAAGSAAEHSVSSGRDHSRGHGRLEHGGRWRRGCWTACHGMAKSGGAGWTASCLPRAGTKPAVGDVVAEW